MEKDRAIRRNKEVLFLLDVEKLAKRIAERRLEKTIKTGEALGRLRERYPRVAKYYSLEYDEINRTLQCEADELKRAKAEELDGTYLLQSDRNDLSGPELWRLYMLLWTPRGEYLVQCRWTWR